MHTTESSANAVPPAATANRPIMIALTGPPAAGKSTASAALHRAYGVDVFRLRDFALRCRVTGRFPPEDFATSDPFGWLDDDLVNRLLRVAFLGSDRPFDSDTVLENFPGSALQLELLRQVAADGRRALALVELCADDMVLAARVEQRRVCSTCDPDLLGEPHKPAQPQSLRPSSCVACGGYLTRRRSDAPDAFRARLQRYRQRRRAVHSAAAAHSLSHERVDAGTDLAMTERAIVAAVGRLGVRPRTSLIEGDR